MEHSIHLKEKEELLSYFLSSKCKCGRPKLSKMYLCHSCWEKLHTTKKYEELFNSCETYILKVKDLLREVEVNKEPES